MFKWIKEAYASLKAKLAKLKQEKPVLFWTGVAVVSVVTVGAVAAVAYWLWPVAAATVAADLAVAEAAAAVAVGDVGVWATVCAWFSALPVVAQVLVAVVLVPVALYLIAQAVLYIIGAVVGTIALLALFIAC